MIDEMKYHAEKLEFKNNDLKNSNKIYNKLVRDNILKIIESNGKKATHKILCEKDYSKELNNKLFEEICEFMETNEPEELADIMEVIYAIITNKNMDIKDIEEIRLKKEKRKRWI